MKNKDIFYDCVCCEKQIKKFEGMENDSDWQGMFLDGIVEKISAGYGSSLDGDMYIIAICDDCVESKNLKYVGDYIFPSDFDNNH